MADPWTLPAPGGPALPKNFSIRFGAHKDAIYGTPIVDRSGPMIPSAPAPTRAAHAAYLTAHHPTPHIMDEHFPTYATALANLQEEPTPFKLPTFKGSPF